jgi:integral membrane sensor domain MASE1
VSDAVWTWVLAGFELAAVGGFFVIGHKIWWGWSIVLLSSIAWLVYSITFNKPGFVVMSLIWGVAHTRNMIKWLLQKRNEERLEDNDRGKIRKAKTN